MMKTLQNKTKTLKRIMKTGDTIGSGGRVDGARSGVQHFTGCHSSYQRCTLSADLVQIFFFILPFIFTLSPPSPFPESLNETLSLSFSSSAAEHRTRLELVSGSGVSGVLPAVLCKLFV